MEPHDTLGIAFEQALLSLDRLAAREILIDSPTLGPPHQRVEQLIIPTLERIGDGWSGGTVSLAQVYMSSRICEELVDEILPSAGPARTSAPRMAIAVLEDYHLLGKRIVYSTLRSGGFDLLDYGQMAVDSLVERVLADRIEILLISTLMLPSALRIRDVRDRLDQAGADVVLVVGGAPFRFDDQLWQQVGADATADSASDTIEVLHRLIGERK
jgi:methanogenic corrinoid protein MtbC1